MKWLKTLFGKQQTTSTGEEQEKLDRAFRVGQEAAQSMVADLDGFIDSRFGHLKEAYLGAFAGGGGILRLGGWRRWKERSDRAMGWSDANQG